MTNEEWAALLPDVARRLLDERKSKTAREWRYGNHGSLAVNVGGPWAGRWYDFEARKGGDVLALIQRERGGLDRIPRADSVQRRRCFTGNRPSFHSIGKPRPQPFGGRVRRSEALYGDFRF